MRKLVEKKLFCNKRWFGNIALPKTRTVERNDEYGGPNVKTELPGPNTLKAMESLKKSQELYTKTTRLVVDVEKCKGNYLVDVDGNVFLDVICQFASLCVGYNNPNVREGLLKNQDLLNMALMNRTSLGELPKLKNFVGIINS